MCFNTEYPARAELISGCFSSHINDIVFMSIFDTMSKKTRAKFQCNSVTDFSFGKYFSNEVKLSAVYPNKDSVEENSQFNEASPTGQMTITIDNPAVKGFFKPGVQYYLDIEAAPRDSQDYPESYDKLMENN